MVSIFIISKLSWNVEKSCLTAGQRSRDIRRLSLSLVTVQRLFWKFCHLAWNVEKKLFDSRPTVAWPPTTIAWPFSDFFENFAIWLETSRKSCLTVGRRSRDLRRLSRDRSAIFLKILPLGLKHREKVAWQSADGRVTSDDFRVTVQRFFWKFCHLAWNIEKKLLDSRPTVAWHPTTFAWPFSDFFENFAFWLETSRKSCLTVGRRSRDLQRLSLDRSATFLKILPFGLKRREKVVWQSADGRVTSDDYRVAVQRLFWKFCHLAWNVEKKFFDSRPTVAWPPTTIAWPFSDFFENFAIWFETSRKSCLTVGRRSRDLRRLSRDRSATFLKISSFGLKRREKVFWQSADGRVTSDNYRVTVQRLFWKFRHLAWNVEKKLFNSRPTVAWTPTTIAWPFGDVFENFAIWLETSKKSGLTVGRRSRDLRRLSRDRSATFLKILPFGLERREKVVWQSADGRVTSVEYCVIVQRFFQSLPFLLKIEIVWQSADGRVTIRRLRTTVCSATIIVSAILFNGIWICSADFCLVWYSF